MLLAVAALGLAGLVLAAAVNRRDLAFTNGVPIVRVAAVLQPAETICQTNVEVRERFTALELVPRWLKAPGPPLRVTVADRGSGARLADIAVPRGYPDNRPLRLAVKPPARGSRIDICVLNRGDVRLGLEGGKAESAPDSPLTINAERDEYSALSLRFVREPRSVLSQVPTMFERAALFRPSWTGAWTFWLLAIAVGIGVPALLARALAIAERPAPEDPPGPSAPPS